MKFRWYRTLAVACLPIILAGCASSEGTNTGDSYWTSSDLWKCAGSGAVVGGAAGATEDRETAAWGALGGALVGAVVCGLSHEEKAAPVKEEPVEPAATVTETVLNEVNGLMFTLNSSTLQPRVQSELDTIIPGIVKSNATVVVAGYTDTKGKAQYNKYLSQQRADAVAHYLEEQGVNAANISTVGYGEANPVADNSTLAGRKKNRRVTLKIKSTKTTN